MRTAIPPEVELIRAIVDMLVDSVGPIDAAVGLRVLEHPLPGSAGDYDAHNRLLMIGNNALEVHRKARMTSINGHMRSTRKEGHPRVSRDPW